MIKITIIETDDVAVLDWVMRGEKLPFKAASMAETESGVSLDPVAGYGTQETTFGATGTLVPVGHALVDTATGEIHEQFTREEIIDNTIPLGSMDFEIPKPPAPETTLLPEAVVPVPPAQNAAGVEIDSEGLPWDSRIHSRERSKVASGQWRVKRKTDDVYVEQIKAELRAAMNAPRVIPTNPASLNPVPTAPVPAAPAPTAAVPSPVPAVPAAPAPVVTLGILMREITIHMTAGTITNTWLNEECVKMGLPSVAAIHGRDDLIRHLYERIQARIQGGADAA